jgi:hypothetical protein
MPVIGEKEFAVREHIMNQEKKTNTSNNRS